MILMANWQLENCFSAYRLAGIEAIAWKTFYIAGLALVNDDDDDCDKDDLVWCLHDSKSPRCPSLDR